MKSILDVEISCFSSYSSKKPETVNLLSWLTSNKYAKQIQSLRQLENKSERDKIKASLPAVTISGQFHPTRKTENLVKHSGLICIDIDAKDNEHIQNFTALKEELFNIQQVAYAGRSASGKGFFIIVPIAYPHRHKAHFAALEKQLATFDLNIDPAPKNIASLRGYSWDPEALFRHDARVYTYYERPSLKKKLRKSTNAPFVKPTPQDTKARVEQAIQRLIQQRKDITSTEPDWFRIACALANEFGEQGRGYFHSVSQFHPEYDSAQTDKKFDHALKGQFSRIGIGTFFGLVG